MKLEQASRKKAKIKLGLSSVSGGGKTFSSILIAKGLCVDLSRVAIIDTENNSADLYAHLGNYQVLPLTAPFSPERYIEAISICEKAKMEVIIIDSISHEWEGKGGILELSDQLGGQYQSAWKTLTPRNELFKQAIIQSPCHVITTVRRKQDYVLQEKQNKNGKIVQTPVKAGFKEVTREGWEYELSVNLELELNHFATASKDRTNLFMGKPAFIPNEDTGEIILKWCNQGVDPLSIAEQIEANTDEIIKRVEACKTVNELIALYKLYPKYQESLIHQFTGKRQLLENKTITNTQNINNNGTPINK